MRTRHTGIVPVLGAALLTFTAVAACGDEEPEAGPATDGTEPVAVAESTVPTDTTAPEPTTATSPATTGPPVTVESVTGALVETIEGPPFFDVVLPWQGGFLVIGYEYQPQLIPELEPEIVALFPPEVVELLSEGPYDRYEAMDILREAELLDEVMTILEEHPEAAEALTTDPLPPLLLASWSQDGLDWTAPAPFLPDGISSVAPAAFSVAGDRLIAIGPAEPYDQSLPVGITVATTTDLITWETVEFEAAPESTEQEPYPLLRVVGNDDGWVATVHWLAEMMTQSDPAQVWTGQWSGEAVRSDVDDSLELLFAAPAGFVATRWKEAAIAPDVVVSPDGTEWHTVELPDGGLDVAIGFAPLGDGAVMLGRTSTGGTATYVIDATATEWRRVDLPDEVGQLFVMPNTTPAFLAHDDAQRDREGWWLIAAADGERWLVEPYEFPDEADPWPPMVAATNGEHVIAGVVIGPYEDGVQAWQRYTLPSASGSE